MVPSDVYGLLAGAVLLGAVHGVEPGHGWPVAASYALEKANKWLYGLAASLIIGVGHLVSSIAMVAVFFYAKSYFSLTQVNEPLHVFGVEIGGPVSVVAGVVLVALGVHEYRHGHSHDHGHGTDDERDDRARDEHEHSNADHDHGHSHDHGQAVDRGHAHDHGHDHHDHSHASSDDRGHGHSHDHGHHHDRSDASGHDHADHDDHEETSSGGVLAWVKRALPFVGGHSHASMGDAQGRGLYGIAWFAFVLGFAHEEEFEIIALCAGSNYCLELMTAYALTVIVGIVGLTMLLIAGYERSEERVKRLTPYLPAFSAAVLCVMGVGFVLGVF